MNIRKKLPFWLCLLVMIGTPVLPTKAILALVALTAVGLGASLSHWDEISLTRHPSDAGVVVLGCLYVLATLVSMGGQGNWKVGALMTAFLWFYLLVIHIVRTCGQLMLLTKGFLWSSVPIALYGLYQYLFPEQFSFSSQWVDPGLFPDLDVRIYSTFANPNVFGCYLLLAIPFALGFFFAEKRIPMRCAYGLAGGVLAAALVLTWSRGCWLGAIFAVFVFFLLMDKRFLLLAVAAIPLVLLFAPESILHRFLSIGNLEDTSTYFRVLTYTGVISMLRENWLLGIGPGAFERVFPLFSPNGIITEHAHSLYLQLICDAGVPALGAFLWILAGFARALRHAVPTANREQRCLMAASIASLSGFLVQSLFDHTFYNYRVMLLFWGIAALTALHTRIPRLTEECHD